MSSRSKEGVYGVCLGSTGRMWCVQGMQCGLEEWRSTEQTRCAIEESRGAERMADGIRCALDRYREFAVCIGGVRQVWGVYMSSRSTERARCPIEECSGFRVRVRVRVGVRVRGGVTSYDFTFHFLYHS